MSGNAVSDEIITKKPQYGAVYRRFALKEPL